MEEFCGKWRSTDVYGFEEFLEEMNVSYFKRLIVADMPISVEFQKLGGSKYRLTYKIGNLLKGNIAFKIGVPFFEETPDGRRLKTVFYFEDGWFKQYQRGPPKNTLLHRRLMADGRIEEISTIENSDVECVRIYERC